MFNSYLIAFIATIVHSYDYALFGLTAARLSKEFFPGSDDVEKILNFFFMFAVTLLIRPFASLVLGKIGDKYGRAVVLRIATIGIAIPICIVTFIPPYSTLGIYSTLLFVLCRICVITFLAGEVDGIRIYINEKINPKNQFFGSGLVTTCSQAGSFIAASMSWVSGIEVMPDWAWRVNFLIGAVAGLLILILREMFEETEAFLKYKNSAEFLNYSNMSIFKLINNNKKAFIKSILTHGAIGSIYHFYIIFFGVYIFQILTIADEDIVRFYTIVTIFAYMVSALISGWVIDRTSPKLLASLALISSIALCLANVVLIAQNIYKPWIQIAIGACTPMHTSVTFVLLKKQFNTGVRYRLFSFAHALGAAILSATTPMIAAKLWKVTQLSWLPLMYPIVLLSFLLFILQTFVLKDNKLEIE